ncbi:MAG: DNA topoisomerase 1 [Flavobacteriaceae bacterium]|nr:DNA topoisomerase 1 [Flavobacteriaceae bacterium]
MNYIMSKKYYITPSLVIVESPAKCSKIQQYLGNCYKVIASYGHLRELNSIKNITFNNNNTVDLKFDIINNKIKRKQIEVIKNEIKKCDEVILASDSDREGEAIAWHICQLFNLDVNKCKRIVFNEVTETAINHAIKNPRTINMDLVHAQQARQVLDLLVGFKISPVLWKFITYNAKNSLSAGRCQTPALGLVYDNQIEINEQEKKKNYNTIGYFTTLNLPFELNKRFEKEAELNNFLELCKTHDYLYKCTPPTKVNKTQPEPFTTSKLQQTVSNELRYSPKDTMKLCQSLYEGGYITYMRTDSKTYSKDFVDSVKPYVLSNYDAKYLRNDIDTLVSNSKPPTKKKSTSKYTSTKKPLTQDAHEAIRPTNILTRCLNGKVGNKEARVYKLIWENTLESCMSKAVYHSIKSTVSAPNELLFQKNTEQVYFPGWKIVKNKNELKNDDFVYLQTIPNDTIINYRRIRSTVTITNMKSHYTEAKLVQLLEEKGIGRPSTYSMLLDKIQERSYVKKEDIAGEKIECKDYELVDNNIKQTIEERVFGNEKNKLVITSLGMIVMKFLREHFSELFKYEYTKNMEDDLDIISKGEGNIYTICNDCNQSMENLISNLRGKAKVEFKIDDNHTYMVGKYGPVIKCIENNDDNQETISYKSVKQNIDLKKLENQEYAVSDIVLDLSDKKNDNILGVYDNENVFLKKSKYGIYIQWGKNTKSLKTLKNKNMETITLEDVLPFLESGSNIVRDITENISIRNGPRGHYIYFKTAKMKKPKFFDIKKFNLQYTELDYTTCDIELFQNWCKDTHKIP